VSRRLPGEEFNGSIFGRPAGLPKRYVARYLPKNDEHGMPA
jgi:hypothetical protein